MVASNKKRAKSEGIKNLLMVADFEDMVSEESLDELFYPKSEQRNRLFGASAINHPLHPEFKPPSPIPEVRGLLGGLISPALNVPIDTTKMELAQALRVARHREHLKSHAVYKWLCEQENFNAALASFERKRKHPSVGTNYMHPYSEFRFLWCVTRLVVRFVSGGCKPSARPSGRQKGQAIGHIEKLLTDMSEFGIGLRDFTKNRALQKGLEELRDELIKTKDQVAPRDDDTRGHRELISWLAMFMHYYFGEASPAIISKLVAISGTTFEEKMIITNINAALKPYRPNSPPKERKNLQ